MIPLQSTKKLKKSIIQEYAHLHSVMPGCSVKRLEDIMRRIHLLSFKIKHYDTKKESSFEIEDTD